MNLFRSIAAVAAIPGIIKSQFMAVAAVYSGVLCVLRNALRQFSTWDDWSGLFGASNCSSTSGGRPASTYVASNPFMTLIPPPAVPIVTVSAAGQQGLVALATNDPVLAPIPLGSLAILADQASSGITVRG